MTIINILYYLKLSITFIGQDIKKLFVRTKSGKQFRKGDRVQSPDGTLGNVWRVCYDIKTGKAINCIVFWETPYKGENFSITPAIDKGNRFNPLIKHAS